MLHENKQEPSLTGNIIEGIGNKSAWSSDLKFLVGIYLKDIKKRGGGILEQDEL
jgi:hypothetical protein